MEQPPISPDDLTDIMEMTRKIENCIFSVLEGNDLSISMSALVSASVNCLIASAKTIDEALLFKELFIIALDSAINQFRTHNPK